MNTDEKNPKKNPRSPTSTRKKRSLELTTIAHTYDKPGRYTVAVKVIDIFGNDTMTLVPVNVG